jgi:hypothetical protein
MVYLAWENEYFARCAHSDVLQYFMSFYILARIPVESYSARYPFITEYLKYV